MGDIKKRKRSQPASTKGIPKGKGRRNLKKRTEKQIAQAKANQPIAAAAASEALKGNQFWRLRAKHGRDKIFASPEILWESACEYFNWCDENPWMRTDFKGKDADRVLIPTERPYTMAALSFYLGCNRVYFTQFRSTCSEDFAKIIAAIDEVMYSQKFEGAAVGAFNANLISRDLGLKDSMDIGVSDSRKAAADMFPFTDDKQSS